MAGSMRPRSTEKATFRCALQIPHRSRPIPPPPGPAVRPECCIQHENEEQIWNGGGGRL